MSSGPERLSAFRNRLAKNARHWGRWARRQGLECYRVYDRDLGEAPLAIDRYDGHLHVQFYRSRWQAGESEQQAWRAAVIETTAEVLDVPPDHIHAKTRQRQKGRAQYERAARAGEWLIVHEQGRRFRVNLDRYLDTGLFLDHRLTRARVAERIAAQGPGACLLNLYCYTGSFTVYAATAGAAASTSVDLSRTYLDWTRRNLDLNGIEGGAHRLVQADVSRYLQEAYHAGERFDLIVLDPPSFSNSKRMREVLDTQRDHPALIRGAMALLRRGGELYFSTNKRHFRLDPSIAASFDTQDIRRATLPADFRDPETHYCWLIRHPERRTLTLTKGV